MSRDGDNRDFIKGVNYPRQSYAVSGTQWGDSNPTAVRGKKPTDSSPMIITNTPPGSFAYADDAWKSTFGASSDAYLSLISGRDLNSNKTSALNNLPQTPFLVPSVANSNIYEKALGIQQVQYVVSKNTVNEAALAQNAGEVAELRTIGLRMPSQLAGWGYTIGLRPTDPTPANKRINDEEHKLDRATWRTGPLDVRWDNTRKNWRAWNDLIADQADNNLGTFVFGSSSDPVQGFPFQRGKLEDVWWVRSTVRTVPEYANGDDTTKTAEVCTSLKHKLFDPIRKGAGPLWNVFICHGGEAIEVGGETTYIGAHNDVQPPDGIENEQSIGGNLEIRTTTRYHYSDTITGPIRFTSEGYNESEESFGKMKIVAGQWSPTYNANDVINKATGGFCGNLSYLLNMTRLVDNDENIIFDGVFDLQRMVCTWNEEYTDCILKHLGWTAKNAGSSIWALNHQLAPYLERVSQSLIKVIMGSVASSLNSLRLQNNATIQSVAQQIIACIAALHGGEINCPLEVPNIGIGAPAIPYLEVPRFSVPGFGPPNCLIKSFAAWQYDTGEELSIFVKNPCTGGNTWVGSCGNFGNSGTGGIDIDINGGSFGGTDADGDVNIGGSSFGDPSAADGDPSGQDPPGAS